MSVSPIEPLMPYLNTLVFFAAYTVLYKDNPLYRFVQSLVVGIGGGYLLVAQIDLIRRTIVPSFGKPEVTLAIILGAMFLCIFIPSLLVIYRMASIVVMTVGLGTALPFGIAIVWTASLAYSQGFLTSGLGGVVRGLSYALALSYFLFTATLEKPTAPFRTLGRIVLLVYTAMCISMTALGKLNLIQWKTLDAIWGVPATWFVPVGLFILILIDRFVYPFRNLVSGEKKE